MTGVRFLVEEVCHNPDNNARQLTAAAEHLGVGFPAASIGCIHQEIDPDIEDQFQHGLASFVPLFVKKFFSNFISITEARDTMAVFRPLLVNGICDLIYVAASVGRLRWTAGRHARAPAQKVSMSRSPGPSPACLSSARRMARPPAPPAARFGDLEWTIQT